MFKAFLISSLFITSFSVATDLVIVSKNDHDVRLLKTIKVDDSTYVYLTARDHGHVLGQKILVETRVSCEGDMSSFSDLEVVDSQSVCNMSPESIVVNNANTAVAMASKTANINRYYAAIEKGESSPEVLCNEKSELLKFSLKNLCE